MTNLDSVLSANVARTNFYQILNEADEKLRQFVVTLRGKVKAVVMPYEEYSSWKETLEILTDSKLSASLRRALKSKKTYTQEQVDKILGW